VTDKKTIGAVRILKPTLLLSGTPGGERNRQVPLRVREPGLDGERAPELLYCFVELALRPQRDTEIVMRVRHRRRQVERRAELGYRLIRAAAFEQRARQVVANGCVIRIELHGLMEGGNCFC